MTEKDNELSEELWEQEPLVIYPKGVKVRKKLSAKQKILIGITVAIVIFYYLLQIYYVLRVKPLIQTAVNSDKMKDTPSVSANNSLEQEVERYLEERYNEQFVVKFVHGRGYTDHALLHGYPIDHPDDERYEFEIQVYYYKGGKKEFYDGYTMIKLADEYEAYIDEILGDCFDEYKFHMEFYSEWITTNLPVDITLEELWKNYRANADYPLPRIDILIPPETKPGQIKAFAEKLGKSSYRGVADMDHYYDKSLYDRRAEDAWDTDETEEIYTVDHYYITVYDADNVECEGRRVVFDGAREKNEEQRNQIMHQIIDYGALIIDCSEDGIYTRPVENGIHFFYDEDEYLDQCSYIQESDRFLVLKLDEPDNPYGIKEDRLIPYMLQYGPSDPSGNIDYIYIIDSFEFLKKLDDNQDGVLDSRDDSFWLLRWWNSNDVEMEMWSHRVDEEGIVGGVIDLNAVAINEKDDFGNLICYESTIHYDEGDFPYIEEDISSIYLEDADDAPQITYKHREEATYGIREYRFECITADD